MLSRRLTVRVQLILLSVGLMSMALCGMGLAVLHRTSNAMIADVDRKLTRRALNPPPGAPRPGEPARSLAKQFPELNEFPMPPGDDAGFSGPGKTGPGKPPPGGPSSATLGFRRPPSRRPPTSGRLFDLQGNPLADPNDKPWNREAIELVARTGKPVFTTELHNDEEYRVVSWPLKTGGRLVRVVQISEPLAENEALSIVRRTLLEIIPFALVVAAFTGLLMTSRVLRPVRELAHAAEQIGAENLSERLPAPGQDEFSSLARTINSMLGRIDHAFRVQKEAEVSIIAAREAAEAANRSKSEFLAGMSHEIRTPMNAIMGMAEVLSETELTPDQRKYVDVFSRAGETLLTLINDILDLSKVEAGHLELERADFDLRELLERTTEILNARAEPKGLKLSLSIASELPSRLNGDAHRLRQVIVNLVGNALKFTERGEVAILVAPLAEVGADTILLQFSVRDPGIGIPANKLEAIFADFVQGDSSTTRQYGGTGLGLAICRRLVSLMDGRLWVESVVGQGSTFSFTARFARALTAPAPPLSSGTAGATEDATPALLRPLRVLLVDDSDDNRLLVTTYLKSLPYQLVEAVNGEAAVARFLGGKFDLVLMDIQMPVMDGLEATRRIRCWERDHKAMPTPIIALTASALEEEAQKCLDAGCSLHLSKPIKRAELLAGMLTVTESSVPDVRVLIAGNPALAEIIPGYLRHRHEDVADLTRALAENDFETVRVRGHRMRGSGASYGFDDITEIGAALERAADSNEVVTIRAQIAALQEYLDRVESRFPT